MSYVWEWVRNITLVVILFSFIEILLPGSNMNPYLKFIFSLAVLAMMLSPLAAVGKADISVFGEMPVSQRWQEEAAALENQDVSRVRTKQIEDVYLEKLISWLREELNEKFSGISIGSIEIYMNNEVESKGFGAPQRARISIDDPEYEKAVRNFVADHLQIEKRSVGITLTGE